jgi:hypothetical protein
MKYAVEMGSGSMICMPSSVKTGSDVKKLIRGNSQRHTDRIVIL